MRYRTFKNVMLAVVFRNSKVRRNSSVYPEIIQTLAYGPMNVRIRAFALHLFIVDYPGSLKPRKIKYLRYEKINVLTLLVGDSDFGFVSPFFGKPFLNCLNNNWFVRTDVSNPSLA